MSKKLKILIAILLVITCIVAVIHKSQQEEIACMVIRDSDREIPVDFSDLDQMEFSGELMDGKGTVTFHTYRGILLKDLLTVKNLEVSDLKVYATDNYSVEFTKNEILAENKVYAAISADGKSIEGIDSGTDGVQIIVFGDPNSKRCVQYAAIIEMIP